MKDCRFISVIRYKIFCCKMREKKSKKFSSSKPHYFIVRLEGGKNGFCSNISCYMARMNYMETRYPDAIPVVDMKNYSNALMNPGERVKSNLWDVVFQPLPATLETAYGSGNYILSEATGTKLETMEKSVEFLMEKDGSFEKWNKLFQKYFVFNAKMKELFLQAEKRIPQNSRCLGVLCRGTDYSAMRPQNHPIQPTPNQMMDKVAQVMEEKSFEYIVLATEDSAIADGFKKRFGNRCILTRESYVAYGDGALVDSVHDVRENTIQYMVQLYLLSRCQGLVSGITSASPFILFMAQDKPFEYKYFWDLGTY